MIVGFVRVVDALSLRAQRIADWCVLLATAVSAGNAFVRYGFNWSTNALLETQWYLFAAVVLLAGAHTLRRNEHVRVDLVYSMLGERGRLWVDVFGLVVFLLPVAAYLTWLCAPFFWEAWRSGETSVSAGGLVRWPVRALLLVGFALLLLQGMAELARRLHALRGHGVLDTAYQKPLQ